MKAVVRNHDDLVKFCSRAATTFGTDFGRPMTVTLTRYRRPRTIEQNAKLHAMWHELAMHTGYSEAEIKDFMKAEFGPTKQVQLRVINTGEVKNRTRTIPKGTSEYSVEELSNMIERTYQVAAQAGCEFSVQGGRSTEET